MTLDEIARTYGIEDQVRDMPDLRPARHWAMRQAARATHERNPELHRVSALRVGIAIAATIFLTYALIVGAMLVTP